MMSFWIISVLMIAVALLLIAPALLRKPQAATQDRDAQNIVIARERLAELDRELANDTISHEEHAHTKMELEQGLLQDLDSSEKGSEPTPEVSGLHGRISLLSLLVALPLLSVLLYQQLGTPELIKTAAAPLPVETTAAKSGPVGSMEQLALKLRQRLEEKTPGDADGWFLLGRTYASMKEHSQAVAAYEKAYQLIGDDPTVMLALADALSMTQEGRMSGRAAELVKKSLVLEPQNTTALWMAGLSAADGGDYAGALRLWERLHPLLADSPEEQQQLTMQIARVAAAAGITPPASQISSARSASLKLRVSLAPALLAQAGADDTVFIYAKAMNGPRFPLAAARHRVADLPLEITLDDSSAVMASAKLSGFPQVKVGARVSRSGDAITRSGDLSGEKMDIKVGSGELVELVIDRVQP